MDPLEQQMYNNPNSQKEILVEMYRNTMKYLPQLMKKYPNKSPSQIREMLRQLLFPELQAMAEGANNQQKMLLDAGMPSSSNINEALMQQRDGSLQYDQILGQDARRAAPNLMDLFK